MRTAKPAAARALAVVALIALAACGTRLPDEAFVGAGEVVEGGDVTNGDTTDTTAFTGSDGNTATTGGSGTGGSGTGGSGTGGSGTGGSGTGAVAGPNQASDVGVTTTAIRIGNITAEKGLLGDAFAPAVRGLRAWVADTNARGGIRGRRVELFTCDDREDRARSLECARRLVERDKVFALVATNSRSLGGAAQYLEDNGVPVIGVPITNSFNRYSHFWSVYGSLYARDGETVGYKNNIISYSGGYRWFKQNLGVDTAAVFFYDIDESSQAGEFIAKGLDLEGYDVTTYTVSFAAPSFDQHVADMKRKGVEIIFDAMDDGANRGLCDAMARGDFSVKAKVSTVVSYGDSVGENYNETCRNSVYITGDSRPYSDTSVPAIAAFRNAFARYQPGFDVHQWALEAWAMGIMFREGVETMGAAPTRKGLESFLRGLRRYSADGIMTGIQYLAVDGEATRGEDCFTVGHWVHAKKRWEMITSRFPFCYADAYQYKTEALEQGN